MFPGDEPSVWLSAHLLKTLMIADFQVGLQKGFLKAHSIGTAFKKTDLNQLMQLVLRGIRTTLDYSI